MSGHEKAIAKDGFLKNGSESFQIGSNLWFKWLSNAKKFSFKCNSGGFVAQHETRRNRSYWYAYKRRDKKLYKAYLGKTEELTLARLQQVGSFLQGKETDSRLVPNLTSSDPYLFESRIDSSFLPLTKITVPVLRMASARTTSTGPTSSPSSSIVGSSPIRPRGPLPGPRSRSGGSPRRWLKPSSSATPRIAATRSRRR